MKTVETTPPNYPSGLNEASLGLCLFLLCDAMPLSVSPFYNYISETSSELKSRGPKFEN